MLFGTGDPVAGGRKGGVYLDSVCRHDSFDRATAFVALPVVFAFDSNNRIQRRTVAQRVSEAACIALLRTRSPCSRSTYATGASCSLDLTRVRPNSRAVLAQIWAGVWARSFDGRLEFFVRASIPMRSPSVRRASVSGNLKLGGPTKRISYFPERNRQESLSAKTNASTLDAALRELRAQIQELSA